MHIGDTELPRALSGDALTVPSLTRLDQVIRRLGVPERAGAAAQRAALDRIAGLPRGTVGSHLQFIQRSQVVTFASSARIEEILRGGKPDRASRLSRRWPGAAAQARRPAHQGGAVHIDLLRSARWIRHSPEPARGACLAAGGVQSISSAFFEDLERAGEEKRVILLAFSEFGRRLTENASRGTDHGTAAPIFLAGPGVRPGLHGPYPNLTDLEDGDPRYAIDFRRVYSTLLDCWLNCPSRLVLGEQFTHLDVL